MTPPVADAKRISDTLIMEVVSDQIPLLISEHTGTNGLPAEINSAMIVPLKIRDKVFGVITAIVNQGQKRFAEKDLYYLSFLAQSAAQAIENLALYENIYENLFATLYAFVKAVEARDLYTRQHSSRVTGLSIVLGKQLGCSKEELDILNFAGHLHDIGKNLVTFMLDVNGFAVYDLGIDVKPQIFVDKIREIRPQIVGLSGFLTSVYQAMKDTVDAIVAAGLRNEVKIMIGGGVMDEEVRKFAGADAYGQDAMAAVDLARDWLGGA